MQFTALLAILCISITSVVALKNLTNVTVKAMINKKSMNKTSDKASVNEISNKVSFIAISDKPPVNTTSDKVPVIEISDNVSVNKISESLIKLLRNNATNRINELSNKLATINNYIVDKEQITKLLINITKETELNETNFLKSLSDDDHYSSQFKDDGKNLFLKLKEKMNRDDVQDVITRRWNNDVLKSARKAMAEGGMVQYDDVAVEDVVDKLIAERPKDEHKYKLFANESRYWDPQSELQELNEFHQHDGRRIYKGERTNVRYYPFMVSIQVMGRFWCGGVIYWDDLVITSASCLQLMHNNRFFRENPKVLSVRVGSNHSKIGGEIIEALEVYFHPAYNPKTLNNNIAVIRLRRHLSFSYHRIPKIISISHNPDGVPATAEVLLLGWGVSTTAQSLPYMPVYLQRKFLPIYPNMFCKEVYGKKFITNRMFCAGTLTTGEGACNHDAGGPAILAGKLVGIISFGPTVCGFPNAPTVFTLVGAVADWIERINETVPSYIRGKKRTTTTTPSAIKEIFENWSPVTKRVDLGLLPLDTLNAQVPLEVVEETRLRKGVDNYEGFSMEGSN